jgi:hypothetical protein
MKKLVILILFAASLIFAQDNNKGRISFVFNGEKIVLPINTVTIMKQNNIIINTRAEHNDSTSRQMVAMEIGLEKLSADSSKLTTIKVNIDLKDFSNLSGKNITFSFNMDIFGSVNGEKDNASYVSYNKGERLSWDINSIQLTVDKMKINYTGKELKITGGFSVVCKPKVVLTGQIAEIKDCTFEIIL